MALRQSACVYYATTQSVELENLTLSIFRLSLSLLHCKARLLKLILVMVLAQGIVACKSLPVLKMPSANSALPEWVATPPQEEEAFHAVGQGQSLNQAEQRARESLAAQIQSKTSSQSETYSIQDGDYTNLYHRQTVNNQVSNLDLTGATLANSAKGASGYYALVTLDRRLFLEQLHEQLKQEIPPLKAYLSTLDGPGFESWWTLRKISGLADSVAAKVAAIRAFSDEEHQEGLRQWRDYQQQLLASLKTRTLEIVDKTGEPALRKLVSEQLLVHGVEPVTPLFGKATELRLNTQYNVQHIDQEYHVAGQLEAVLISTSGAVLSQARWQVNAVALDDQGLAISRASEKLYKKLVQKNILTQLLAAADNLNY